MRRDAHRFGPEAPAGRDGLSHLEVVHHVDRVSTEKIETGARHPRGTTDWPLVRIFAQRGKNRPHRTGVPRGRLPRAQGLHRHIRGLDAVDGTPVLDIKPHIKPPMAEFGPQSPTHQPARATAIMRDPY